jgi:hypothetical protein
MARRRFKPDPDFQQTISEAILGGGVQRAVGSGSVRRRRTTLVNVAENIIEEAKRITDSAEGLPSVGPGGRRAAGYDFRAEDRKGKTYRASFRYEIRRERGRFIVVVINDHEHAADVEFGNTDRGRSISVIDGYMRIPITMAAYRRIKAKEKAAPDAFQRERAAARSSIRYWRGQKELGSRKRRALVQQVSRFFDGKKVRATEAQLRKRAIREGERKKEAKFKLAQAERRLARTDPGLRQAHSFVAIGENGKAYLFTKSVSTYRGYGILRHAMRRVTLQQLE